MIFANIDRDYHFFIIYLDELNSESVWARKWAIVDVGGFAVVHLVRNSHRTANTQYKLGREGVGTAVIQLTPLKKRKSVRKSEIRNWERPFHLFGWLSHFSMHSLHRCTWSFSCNFPIYYPFYYIYFDYERTRLEKKNYYY